MNPLEYEYQKPGEVPHDPTVFRIQASSVANYLDNTAQWYAEKLLGEPSKFQDSTSSVLGTAVHACAEYYTLHGTLANHKDIIYEYISLKASELVDEDEVRLHLTPMWQVLKQHLINYPVALVEPYVTTPVIPGVVIGGSIDALRIIGEEQTKPDGSPYTSIEELRGKTVQIVDYKTVGALNAPTKLARGYYFQLVTYAYVLQTSYGITVESINNTYITRNNVGRLSPTTGKPLKDYPSQVTELNQPLVDFDLTMIAGVAAMIADSVELFTNQPQLRHVLSQDNRNRNNTTQLPYIIGQQQSIDI